MKSFAVEVLLSAFGLLISFGLPYFIWRRLRRGQPLAISRPIVRNGSGGSEIPLIAAFGGIRSLPWVGFATNNLNPKLMIGQTGITYRLLRLRTRAFEELEAVDVRIFGATVTLVFVFRYSPFTLEANVGSITLAAETLTILVPKVALLERAKALITDAQLGVDRARAA
jgi:hypothetical protein